MPDFKKTHNQCRQTMCVLCSKHNKNIRAITKEIAEKIKTTCYTQYNRENPKIPCGICDTCRLYLSRCSKYRKPLPDWMNLMNATDNINEDEVCDCNLCKFSRNNGVHRVPFIASEESRNDPIFDVKMLVNLQTNLNLSGRKMEQFQKILRKRVAKSANPTRKIIVKGARKKMYEYSTQLDNFFEVAMLKSCKGATSDLPLIYCSNVKALVDYVYEKRGYSGSYSLKIGMDGGGGFFKICCIIFPENDETKSDSHFKSGGVRQLLILALVPNLMETYDNIALIFEYLNLTDILLTTEKYTYSGDLKLLNILSGCKILFLN